MSRLGCARPVSMKLRWRVDTSASTAKASWLSRRRSRHCRRSAPNALPPGGLSVSMRVLHSLHDGSLSWPASRNHYLPA